MPILTDRLLLRKVLPSDWQALQRIALDFAASPFAHYDHLMPSGDQAVQSVVRFFSDSGMVWAAVLPESGELIGYISTWPGEGVMEIGYRFHSAHHRKGYGFEAVSAVMQHLNEKYGGCVFRAGTALANTPSVRLLAKLGFVETETEDVSFHKDANGNDIVFRAGFFEADMRKSSSR